MVTHTYMKEVWDALSANPITIRDLSRKLNRNDNSLLKVLFALQDVGSVERVELRPGLPGGKTAKWGWVRK